MLVEKEDNTEKAKIYSHSRLWLYESCPEAYKVKYIDKKFPDLPKSIQLFLGDLVHQSLEWLHKKVKDGENVELDSIIHNFVENWKTQFPEEIRISNGENLEFFANKGVKFLIDYYMKNKPFIDNTIEIEKKFYFDLDQSGKYKILGYIDRIVFNKETGEYEVHDYKTNEWMKSQEQVDADRQLAFYHLGLKDLYGSQIKVKLIWHFLAHNRIITSKRTEEDLLNLKKETLELIKKIENTSKWKSCGKRWCDWCDFKKKNSLDNW